MKTVFSVPYTSARTEASVREKLADYPQQRTNTAEAIRGMTMEFCLRPGGPVFSLAEAAEAGLGQEYQIRCLDGGSVEVFRDGENFKARQD